MHHRDGGRDPTELLDSAQQVFYRPTGACHTSGNHPSQPVMCGSFSSGLLLTSPRSLTHGFLSYKGRLVGLYLVRVILGEACEEAPEPR